PGNHTELHSFPTRRSSDLYALQAGLFGAEDQAAKLIERLVAMKLPKVQSIAAVDQQGQGWYVVAVGEYAAIGAAETAGIGLANQDRKSTRLNSSHVKISYA